MKLKKLGLIFLIFCLSLMLFNCGKGTKKEVTISWWHLDTQDKQKAAWQKLADDYMAKNPHVKIEITVLENEAFKQKIATVMQSGDPPDIFRSWGGGVMNEYAKAGLLKDITSKLKGTAWGKSFGQGALGVYSYNGKYYGVPYDMGAVGFWYNKAIFKQLGLKPFETWSELLEGVKKIKAAGIIPIALGEGDKWPGAFWWEYLAVRIGGKDAFDKAYSRKGSFADKPFIEAGEKLKELMALEPFQTGFLAAQYNDEATLVGNRKAAMELMGQWAPYVQESTTPDKKGLGEDLGWFPFPAVEGGAGKPNDILGGGNGYVIGKKAPPEAVDFLQYITSVESQKMLIDVFGIIPTVKGAETAITDPNKLLIVDMVGKAEYFQLYYDQYLPPAVGATVNDAVQSLFAGKTDPKATAEMIEKSMAAESK
jgi:raffinose/stachyose/melibiose transport system substrate-binding protein